MNLLVHFTVLSLFYLYGLLSRTEAGKHGKLLKPYDAAKINIPADILSEFYIGIDSQEDKYAEAIEKVKSRKQLGTKAPKRKKINTENEINIGKRNLRRPHRKNENISKSTLDMREFAKFSRKPINKNVTKSKKKKNLRKSKKKKNISRRVTTAHVGDNSPIDIIIHIKMRKPNQVASLETK